MPANHTTTNLTVSVGIPTYNRASTLKRAIESVLNQDYMNIELVISDNASTDNTSDICQEFLSKDQRVKYIRQPRNLGPTYNFIATQNAACGDFFMWLGDDDWIDPQYISRCVSAMTRDQDVSLVYGRTLYYRSNVFSHEGKRLSISMDNGQCRVMNYFSRVTDNGMFYGLMRKTELEKTIFENTIGNDWLLMAAIVFLGKAISLDDICIHRDLGGATESYKRITESMSLPKSQAIFPHLHIAFNAFQDIVWRVPAFQTLHPAGRYILALIIFSLIVSRKTIGWIARRFRIG